MLSRGVVLFCLMAFHWPASAQQMEHPPPPKAAPRVEVIEMSLPQPGAVMIFGASGEIGIELAQELLSQGTSVTAMVFSPSVAHELEAMGVNVVQGDVLSFDDVVAAIRSGPLRAIVSLQGLHLHRDRDVIGGSKNVIDAADALGVSRVVLLSAIGAGSSHTALPWHRRFFTGQRFEAKTAAEIALRDSGLDYTIIRPGPILDSNATDTAMLSKNSLKYSAVARENLSELVSLVLDDETYHGETLTVFDPSQAGFWSFIR